MTDIFTPGKEAKWRPTPVRKILSRRSCKLLGEDGDNYTDAEVEQIRDEC